MSFKVEYKGDRLRKLIRGSRLLDKTRAEVGFYEEDVRPPDITHGSKPVNAAMLASLLENGNPNANPPVDSFDFMKVAEGISAKARKNAAQRLKRCWLKGEITEKQFVMGVAEVYKEHLEMVFGNISLLRPLAESTIAKKGHNAPLIETGWLREQIKVRLTDD